MNHQVPKTQTITEAARTRLEHLTNDALEFCGISLWHNWDAESWNNSSLSEQPIGQLLRSDVHVFSATPSRTRHGRQNFLKCGTRRRSWTNLISRADQRDSIGTYFQDTQRPKSREKFRHSCDPRNRLISKKDACSCLCSTTLNVGNQATMSCKRNRGYQIREAIQVGSLVFLWTWTSVLEQTKRSMGSHRQEIGTEVCRSFTSNTPLCYHS